MLIRFSAPTTAMALVMIGTHLHAGEGLPVPSSSAPPPQLAEEVRSLRKELFQDLHERQTEKVEALQKELDQVQRDCKRFEGLLAAQEREMAEWLHELQSSELSPGERAQAELARRDAHSESSNDLRHKHAESLKREGELVQRLSREKERLRRFRDVLNSSPR